MITPDTLHKSKCTNVALRDLCFERSCQFLTLVCLCVLGHCKIKVCVCVCHHLAPCSFVQGEREAAA